MTPEDDRKVQALIDRTIRPMQRRLDQLEKTVRRLKSDVQQTKSKVDRLKK